MLTVYGVYANEDNVEGRGRDKLLAQFTNEAAADEYAKQKGPMGASDGRVVPMIVAESVDEVGAVLAEAERRRILDRLTPRERQILGV
jgi:hypothetical protein